ncbi:mitochondrial mRNA pseudouridine synthase RPUSD3-like [Neodiprion virginianus]|uniref:mitochondrial mRNA pseudouridine synthase RPUSD3-like n=1 Tax=Neodiprion virginianus TaxID=2961670 RepID=UPI001EE6D4D4|nr:mitochondrial mRNA pseudouridine synthase RPUSD3-like [Neodiprion virginianus]
MKGTLQQFVQRTLLKIYEVNHTNRLSFVTAPNLDKQSKNRKAGSQKTNDQEKVERDRKPLHPYKKIHPWKSIENFSQDLIDNVIYNKDGVVVLNKPYGISNFSREITSERTKWKPVAGISNSVNYTLLDVLPKISRDLGYPSLSIVKSPERYISGISILASDEKKAYAIKKALSRAQCAKTFARSYWVVTTKLPRSNSGELNLAIRKKESPCKTYKQPIIVTKWGENEVKRREVKTFDVCYRTISTSDGNLSALMEIQCFTTKWHAIRVFASTVLVSPILGDNIHGSRVKKLMGSYMHISPFVDASRQIPILQPELLKKLNLQQSQAVIIPAHIHLREITLMSFPSRGQDLKLVAPLPHSFQWTCDQLQFKIPTGNEEVHNEMSVAVSQ